MSGRRGPRARTVEVAGDRLRVELDDGREIAVPLRWFPRLEEANEAERENWRLIGDGEGIHWPELDEDISVASLLRPEATIPSREIREREGTETEGRPRGTLQGWDDTLVSVYFEKDDPLRPLSGYCVSHDPGLMYRLVDVCRWHLQELDLDDLPPRPGPGDLTPWPPPPGEHPDEQD